MSVESLRKKIKTTQDLRDIVSNMKMLSSVSILQYERADKSLDKYLQNLRDSFHILAINDGFPQINTRHDTKPRILFVLIGSDNGMVGRFNREIADNVRSLIHKKHISLNDSIFITIGKRISSIAESNRFNVFKSYAISNSVKAVSMLSENVILDIDEAIRTKHISEVWIISHHRIEQGLVRVGHHKIIPYDSSHFKELKNKKWDTNNIPMLAVPAKQMFAELINEALMITVAKRINASLAAEHFTRMTNMQNAEKNIDENLEELNLEYQQQRQEDITDELIDVISGAEAMKDK